MVTAQKEPIGYWSLIEPVWEALNSSWFEGCEKFLREFQGVRPEVGHLYATYWCYVEVCNGGFHQFFYNTTGLLAPEALAGYRAIGLPESADILAEAMKFFGSQYPRERTERDELLPSRQRRRRESWDPFYQLDLRFYEFTDLWEDAADAYAELAGV